MNRYCRLIILMLAIAGAAEAQQTNRGPAAPTAAPGLRGAVAPEDPNARPVIATPRPQAREPVAYGARAASAPITDPAPGAGGVAQQCRLTCAQTYYFCLAGGEADDCSTGWSQCRAGCNSDPLPTSY